MTYPGNWQFPREDKGYGHWLINRTRVADRQWKVGVNRIMGHRIGWYVVLGDWSYGICKPESLNTQRERAAGKLPKFSYWWKFVHNAIIHPLLSTPLPEPRWLQRAHDWTADRCQGAG